MIKTIVVAVLLISFTYAQSAETQDRVEAIGIL